MFDARTGVGVRIGVAEAVAIVRGATRLTAIASVTPVATPPPLELRRPGAAWRVASPDGTTVYVGTSGEILAVRTALWRWHDFAWGLHILDLGERGYAPPVPDRVGGTGGADCAQRSLAAHRPVYATTAAARSNLAKFMKFT